MTMYTEQGQEINIEFDVSEEAQLEEEVRDSTPVIGKHDAVIMAATPMLSSQKGTPGLNVEFAVLVEKPEPHVRTAYNTFWLSAKARPYGIIPLCRAVGYLPGKGEFQASELIGRALNVDLVLGEPNDKGKRYSEINTMDSTPFHGLRPIEPKAKADAIRASVIELLELRSMAQNANAPTATSADDIPF
jgi:hypothetical protein